MKDKKRPCKVNLRKYTTKGCCGKWVGVEFEGLFHQWGNEAVEEGDGMGFGNFTVGIVEDENGQIHTVNPNNIKFLDK